MHQTLACFWHELNWCYPLRSEEKQWKETACDMKNHICWLLYQWNSVVKFLYAAFL